MYKKIISIFIMMLWVLSGLYAKGLFEKNENNQSGITNILIGMQDSEDSNVYQGIVTAKKALEDISQKTMSFVVYPSSQLGDNKAMINQVIDGELDIVLAGYPDMSYLIPELKVIGEPYVISDYDHLLRVQNSDYGYMLQQQFMNKGIMIIGDVWYYGTRQTTANKPLESIDDFQGLKMRTPNVNFLLDFAKATGAIPSPIAFQEVYLALQTNQVDAQENPLPTIKAMKFFEVQKNIAFTNHFIASIAVMINNDTWQQFTHEQREWIAHAFMTGKKINNQKVVAEEQSLVMEFKNKGITFTYPNLDPFKDAMQPFYVQLEERFGTGIIEKIMNM